MPQDPYGYDPAVETVAPTRSSIGAILLGLNGFVFGGGGLFWCIGCTGLLVPTYEPDPGDTAWDTAGVWLILMLPAFPLFGVCAVTLGLHALARRWWTSAGPNVVVGGCGGLLFWVVAVVMCAGIAVGMEG